MLGRLIVREFASDVDTALDCASARAAFQSYQYDMVTLDYQFPMVTGLSFSRR
jgi:DNA-binding response OmpR family regulator